MPDLDMGVTVSRDALGLTDLDVNDHTSYKIAAQFLGGQASWNRTTVSSPWVNSETTTQRSMKNVEEQVAFEILADTDVQLQTRMATLRAAMLQGDYVLTVTIGDATYAYQCEAADVQVVWTGVRFMALRGQMIFSVPRKAEPLIGAV